MKLKFSFFSLFLFLLTNLFSAEVVIAKMDIPYNEALTPSNIALIQVEKMPENCRVITIDELKKDKYFTNKYLQKDKVICHSDLKQKSNNKIIFNFGSIQIETTGKIIYENDEYIKIKKENGKVEKIYKDGRDR